jgi:hypothetical protein
MPSCHHVPTDLTAVPRHMGVWRRACFARARMVRTTVVCRRATSVRALAQKGPPHGMSHEGANVMALVDSCNVVYHSQNVKS